MSGANRTSRPDANRAFNERNQKAIQQNHDEVAAHGEVKPLIIDKVCGCVNAVLHNLSLGAFPRGQSDDPDYKQGQEAGDKASMAAAAIAVAAGGDIGAKGGMLLNGGMMLVRIPGGSVIAVPMVEAGVAAVAGGAALAGYGAAVAAKASSNDRFHCEGEGGGRNTEYKNKKPNVSGKEGAKDVPSWVKEEGWRPKVGESGKDFAKRVLDEKYGAGNYNPREEPEFSQIKKWADRSFE